MKTGEGGDTNAKTLDHSQAPAQGGSGGRNPSNTGGLSNEDLAINDNPRPVHKPWFVCHPEHSPLFIYPFPSKRGHHKKKMGSSHVKQQLTLVHDSNDSFKELAYVLLH